METSNATDATPIASMAVCASTDRRGSIPNDPEDSLTNRPNDAYGTTSDVFAGLERRRKDGQGEGRQDHSGGERKGRESRDREGYARENAIALEVLMHIEHVSDEDKQNGPVRTMRVGERITVYGDLEIVTIERSRVTVRVVPPSSPPPTGFMCPKV